MPGRISRTYVLSILGLLALPLFASAVVSQISFTTEPQTIKPGEISGTITIQLQDSSSASANSTETVDVAFSSTSATGEFLSPSSENEVTKTISTGSANKNFRYRDSTSGTFTLAVTATGRTSGAVWSVNQAITLSSTSSATVSSTTPTSSEQSSTPAPSSGGRHFGPSITYVYYSALPLSDVKEEKQPGFGAGRDRVGTAGSPLEFKVESDISHRKNNIFKWNFGDGTEVVGETVVHTYEYPGDYVVMLNSSLFVGRAVARTNVKIFAPELTISSASPERIELKNNSPHEVSLFGRVLVAQGNSFVFPQDTIIKAGQSISFGSKVTGLLPTSVSEVSLLVVGSVEPPKMVARIEEEKARQVAYLENQIALLQNQLARMPRAIQTPTPATVAAAPFPTTTPVEVKPESQTATAVKSGWLGTLKRFLMGAK